MAVTSVVALAISIEEHFRVGTPAVDAMAAGATELAPAVTAQDAPEPVTTVAQVRPALGEALLAGTAIEAAPAQRPRSPFNQAALSIRPSVVGVRAALTNGSQRANVERVGSGVIVDPSGYTVTCNHVVVGAVSISVSRFEAPDQLLQARLIAADGDLALLKFDFNAPLPAVTLADSDQVQVGDWVLAVGHPFGLGLTVTSGIVGRRDGILSIRGGPRYTQLLQTDAPINEGSSGGPLVNLAGEVIGLNTAIYAPTGVFSGAGFAIPSNSVRKFLARYLTLAPTPPSAAGSIWGMTLENLSADQLRSFPSGGAMVVGVEPGSIGDMLRLAPGDVIVSIGADSVSDVTALRRLAERPTPTAIQAQIWRQGRPYSLALNVPNGGPVR